MRILSAFLISSVVFLSFGSCSREFYEGEVSHPRSVALSVSEARRYVESQLASRTRSDEDDSANTLMLGNYTPDWYHAETSVGDLLYSVDAPVTSEYVYYLVGTDSVGKRTLTPMYHKLVVVKEGESEVLSSYIRFYLPEREHARTHPRSYYDSLLNSNPKTRFTGMSVYTTLGGFPVAAGRYENSVLTKKEFLFDTIRPEEDNWIRLANLLDGTYVGRARAESATSQTRSFTDSVMDGVVIIGKPLQPKADENIGFKPEIGGPGTWTDPFDHDSSSGGGGDSSSGDDKPDPNSYDKNPKIKTTDSEVKRYLDQFLADCMGERLVKSIGDDVQITTGYFTSSRTIPNTLGYRSYTIQMNVMLTDYKLMEELIHVNQYSGQSLSLYNARKLNNEIEAKIGWYLYLNEYDRLKSSGAERYLGGVEGMAIFKDLAEFAVCNDVNSVDFRAKFTEAAQTLRGLGGAYADEEKYPFDSNDLTVSKLLEIIGDCFKDLNKK